MWYLQDILKIFFFCFCYEVLVSITCFLWIQQLGIFILFTLNRLLLTSKLTTNFRIYWFHDLLDNNLGYFIGIDIITILIILIVIIHSIFYQRFLTREFIIVVILFQFKKATDMNFEWSDSKSDTLSLHFLPLLHSSVFFDSDSDSIPDILNTYQMIHFPFSFFKLRFPSFVSPPFSLFHSFPSSFFPTSLNIFI